MDKRSHHGQLRLAADDLRRQLAYVLPHDVSNPLPGWEPEPYRSGPENRPAGTREASCPVESHAPGGKGPAQPGAARSMGRRESR